MWCSLVLFLPSSINCGFRNLITGWGFPQSEFMDMVKKIRGRLSMSSEDLYYKVLLTIHRRDGKCNTPPPKTSECANMWRKM